MVSGLKSCGIVRPIRIDEFPKFCHKKHFRLKVLKKLAFLSSLTIYCHIKVRRCNPPQRRRSSAVGKNTVKETFDDVIQEYIDFVNRQVGVYMDALAGFAGHHTRVERQVHRINRAVSSRIDETGKKIVVWASYEDPTRPDIIHNRIIRASDYIAANSKNGSNAQQHSQAILVFLFTYWEDEIRPRLAVSKSIELQEIRSDIMGDLRILRNVILHAKGIIRSDAHKQLKKLSDMFTVDQPIYISYENMHKIFVLIKQDCARMIFEWRGVKDAPIRPENIVDVAIQKRRLDKHQN
jgi:hypothetical protein